MYSIKPLVNIQYPYIPSSPSPWSRLLLCYWQRPPFPCGHITYPCTYDLHHDVMRWMLHRPQFVWPCNKQTHESRLFLVSRWQTNWFGHVCHPQWLKGFSLTTGVLLLLVKALIQAFSRSTPDLSSLLKLGFFLSLDILTKSSLRCCWFIGETKAHMVRAEPWIIWETIAICKVKALSFLFLS